MDEKQLTHISKFLSLVLRHQPETIGIVLDENGWTDVETLLEKAHDHGMVFDKEILQQVVETNAKKRFALNENGSRIRASQGHSVAIELGYTSQPPPMVLYHGTSEKTVKLILENGLDKRNRQHVHLSADVETAIKVGQRHGKPFVFEVMAQEMYSDGLAFYLSANGVWLTHHVPVKYLKRNDH